METNQTPVGLGWVGLDRNQEAGKYLETYKLFERKPPDLIKERVDNDYMSHLTAAFTSVRGVNKTDVTTLASNFGVRLLPLASLSLLPCRI